MITYGGHGPTLPADGGTGPQAATMPQGKAEQGAQKQYGQGGQQGSLMEVVQAQEWNKANSPAIPYGFDRPVGNGSQHARVQDWMDKTGWDGDMRWPPPGFFEAESARGNRLDAMERQRQEIAWQGGETQLAQMRRDQAESDMWAQRARFGYTPDHGSGSGSWQPRPSYPPRFGR